MPVRKGKLKPENEQKIKINYVYLCEELEGGTIATSLYSKSVFTADDKEEVKSKATRKQRAELMLDKLLHSGPGDAYKIFIDILREDYEHVVQRLEERVLGATS